MGKTMGNRVMVELDPENNIIETPSGLKLFIDISFEPEKHIVRKGTVKALPPYLDYDKEGKGMPWKTNMELQIGDSVLMYFLAVQNCLNQEDHRYVRENGKTSIFIDYNNIYVAIRNGEIIPINGYLLVEPMEDPAWEEMIEKMKKSNLEIPDMRKPSITNVTYGKIAYIGNPNEEYFDSYKSDKHYDLKSGEGSDEKSKGYSNRVSHTRQIRWW